MMEGAMLTLCQLSDASNAKSTHKQKYLQENKVSKTQTYFSKTINAHCIHFTILYQ